MIPKNLRQRINARRKNRKDIIVKYPVDAYINNAIRYLLQDYETNKDAISELRFAILKCHGEFHQDVKLALIELGLIEEEN